MLIDRDKIDRALGYPYERPGGSYLFTGGEALPLPPDANFEGRIPVLASGSNGAPAQLTRKFGESDESAIPVTAAKLHDICCSYSAHYSGYGAIAATLCHAPGAVSDVHITWLTEDELQIMHGTEALGVNYDYARLDNLRLQCERRGAIETAFAYISRRGSLLLDGKPVLLKALKFEGSNFPALDQHEIQRHFSKEMSPGAVLEEFIWQTIENDGLRRSRTDYLHKHAQPCLPPHITLLTGESDAD